MAGWLKNCLRCFTSLGCGTGTRRNSSLCQTATFSASYAFNYPPYGPGIWNSHRLHGTIDTPRCEKLPVFSYYGLTIVNWSPGLNVVAGRCVDLCASDAAFQLFRCSGVRQVLFCQVCWFIDRRDNCLPSFSMIFEFSVWRMIEIKMTNFKPVHSEELLSATSNHFILPVFAFIIPRITFHFR